MITDSLNEDQLLHLAHKIKPLVREGKKVFFINPKDIVIDVYFRDYSIHSQATDLEPIMEIETKHKATLSSLFRPSIAEVLCQIPTQLTGSVCAFEIKSDNESLKFHEKTHTHHTKTILYGGPLPETITHQEVILRGHCHTYPVTDKRKQNTRV